jgi:hypothetical protein
MNVSRPALAIAVGLFLPALAAAEFQPRLLPRIQAQRTSGPIVIDGNLDDSGWVKAARADGFAEVSPGDQTQPAVDSEAWIAYDDTHLYIALIAQDDPDDVRVSLCDRDNIYSDDYFGIMIDPYGDAASGYELFVNPFGIQGDLRMLSDGNEDGSFDMIWDSEGRITESGYQVEISVPFASLRLPDRPNQTWRINFWRDHQRDVRRRYAWAAQDRDNPCFMCQFGTLEGLNGITTGNNLEMIVSGIASQAGVGDPDTHFEHDEADADAAAQVKYAVTSSSFAELAVNPDFSQVESDAGQVDVNRTFALFFPERRPFFQEGSDLLGSWIDAIYTRSINDPDVAAKFTGQFDKTSVVYAAAQDAHSPIIIPLEERSHFLLGEKSFSNIVRVRRSLQNESYIGAIATDRRLEGGGSGTTAGLDGLYRIGSYRLELQGMFSRTEEPDEVVDDLDGTFDDGAHTVALDGEDYNGHALYASLERSARNWNSDFDYWEYSPTFRTDNGFTTRNDYRQTSFWNGLEFRPNHEWLSSWGPNVDIGRVWRTTGTFKDEWFRPEVWLDTKWQTHLGTQYLVSRERFGPEVIDGIRVWSAWIDSEFSEMMGAGFSTRFGKGVYRDFDDPELGDQFGWDASIRFKPMSRLELNSSVIYARMDSRERDEELFAGYIQRNRISLNFTRNLFLRLIVQYDDFDEQVDVEPLVTYRVNPFTVFYVGSSSRYRNFQADDYTNISNDDWQMSERQYFAKLQYQFRL